MATPNIMAVNEDTTDAEMSAAKVFNIDELCESIIKHCEATDLPAISMVNQTFHGVCRSYRMLKILLCSFYFFENCSRYDGHTDRTYMQSSQKNNALTISIRSQKRLAGWINALKLKNRQAIVVERYHEEKSRRAAVHFTGEEDIPGLTAEDSELLRGGCVNAIKNSAKLEHDGGFQVRLGKAVLEVVETLVPSEITQ